MPPLSLSPADSSRSDELPHFEDSDIVLDLIGAWDKTLDIVGTEKPVLAVEYASWHALVREHLSVSQASTEEQTTTPVDFELAQFCFGEIEKTRRFLNRQLFGTLGLQVELTPQQRETLQRLQSVARYIPRSLAYEILGFSERRRKARDAEDEQDFLGLLFLCATCVNLRCNSSGELGN